MKKIIFFLIGVIVFLEAAPCSAKSDATPRMNPVSELRGSWEDIGKQQAYYFSNLILQTSFLFATLLGITGDDTLAYYSEVEGMIPESIKEQIQGQALGLSEYWSIPYDTAWKMALVLPFGQDAYNKQQIEQKQLTETETAACTAFALHSVDGTFLCHNTDDMPATLNLYGINHFEPNNGDNSIISFGVPQVFAGVALAVNDQGLGITFNAGSPNKNPASGLPIMMMMQTVMAKCSTLAEGVDYFTGYLENGGVYGYGAGNVLLVDFKDGSMAWLQICSQDIKVTYGQQLKEGVTYIACTNFFDDDFSPLSEQDRTTESKVSAFQRYARVMELLPAFNKYDLAACWNILTDTNGGEPNNNTICRKGDTWHTVYSNVFTADTSYYTLGVPTEYLALYGQPQVIDNKQAVTQSIKGTVTALNKALSQAQVSLKGVTVQGVDMKTYTAADGTFAFNNLPGGTYMIRIHKFFHFPGLAVVNFQSGNPQTVDFNLPF